MSSAVVSSRAFETKVPLLIVGAGAAGLCAALAAQEEGAEPVVIERDAVPAGSTALSAGLIPAAGTQSNLKVQFVRSRDCYWVVAHAADCCDRKQF